MAWAPLSTRSSLRSRTIASSTLRRDPAAETSAAAATAPPALPDLRLPTAAGTCRTSGVRSRARAQRRHLHRHPTGEHRQQLRFHRDHLLRHAPQHRAPTQVSAMSRDMTVSDHKRDNTLTRNLGTHDGAAIVAERDLQLPPRDSRVTEKNQAKEQRGVEQGRALRQSGGQHG